MRARFFLIVTLIVIGFSTANAQQLNAQKTPLTPAEVANKQTERMATELKLNDKQKVEVSAINLKYVKLKNEIFEANKGNKAVFQSKLKEMNVQKKAELKKVLTAEQFTQLEQLQKNAEEKNQKMKQNKGKRNLPPANKVN
jgi:periplasmic protein CpxP/Spy